MRLMPSGVALSDYEVSCNILVLIGKHSSFFSFFSFIRDQLSFAEVEKKVFESVVMWHHCKIANCLKIQELEVQTNSFFYIRFWPVWKNNLSKLRVGDLVLIQFSVTLFFISFFILSFLLAIVQYFPVIILHSITLNVSCSA